MCRSLTTLLYVESGGSRSRCAQRPSRSRRCQHETAARSDDPAAFGYLLGLTRLAGECLGVAARTLAHESSWSQVGNIAGTTRQAAWERCAVASESRGQEIEPFGSDQMARSGSFMRCWPCLASRPDLG